jgi:DNA adenine methylase
MTAPRRPVLRYHGGKFRLAPWVISHFPAHRVYIEPFGGAASVLMRKPRAPGEVYNDIDDEVVGLFRVLRDPSTAEQLRRRLVLTPFSRSEFKAAYEPTADPVERAARLVVRSFMGFGSDSATRGSVTGFRVAVSRQVHVDFMGARRKDGGGQSSAIDWAGWPAAVPAFVQRLSCVVIENQDAAKVMRTSDAADALHYVDPPYPKSTRSRVGAGRGYRHELTDQQHVDLAGCLHGLRGMVVLSGYRCALYDELFASWHRVDRHHRAQAAKASVESLWLNPAAFEGLSQRPLL